MTGRAFSARWGGYSLESQITKALTPDLLQVDLTIKNTGSSRSALEDGIKSILPLPQKPTPFNCPLSFSPFWQVTTRPHVFKSFKGRRH